MKPIFLTIAAAAVIGLGYVFWPKTDGGPTGQTAAASTDTAMAQVILPETLSQNAQIGKTAYDAKCAACHAPNGIGQQGVAPPLIHKIYEPSHHGDESFQRAAAVGVTAHHWKFGNMPPVEGITRAEVKMIVSYIRELQQANGIN